MIRSTLVGLTTLSLLAAPAFATGLTASQSVEVAIVSVDETGQEQIKFEPATEVAPGDTVRYTLSYANSGDSAADNVRLDMPVPATINLLEDSVETGPAIVSFSIDDGASFASRESLIAATDGAASTEDITHIRWTFAESIVPGASGTISYRGVLK